MKKDKIYSTCIKCFNKKQCEYCNSEFNKTYLSKHIQKVHSNITALLYGDYAKAGYVNSISTIASHNILNNTLIRMKQIQMKQEEH